MSMNVEPVPESGRTLSPTEIASWVLAAAGLFLVLQLHLLTALLGGLAVYELVHIVARRLRFLGSGALSFRKYLAVTLIAAFVIAALTLSVLGILAFFRSDLGNLPALLGKMADIVESSRAHLPVWIARELPANTEELNNSVVAWLREHAEELQTFGANLGRASVHALIGMVIGALVSLDEARQVRRRAPLSEALTRRSRRLGEAFRRIVFAQVRISAVNTLLTALYLVVLLPLLGVRLPFTKTMIAITFLAGLLPVIGNLISNTVIVIVGFSYSLGVAVGALVFLIVIHKLEYFLNARIVGSEIQARAWELLVVMLAMEAAFGLSGLIAGPIYYAYVKSELAARGLI
jgi:predicted PurR-regulated permease PerM